MTDAPNRIWATGNKTTGSWNHTPLSLRIAPVQTEYVRADISQARIAELRAALTALMEINDNHSPFGGEIYWDRVERTWDAARAALKAKP
jgi:hypothetical protein